MTSKIRVAVRIRPVKPGSMCPISLSKETSAITVNDPQSGKCVAQYPFDYVFGPNDVTPSVYTNLARDIVINAVKGFNGTIFAYGQTSSGKTHTMIGDSANPGIVRLALTDIFDSIQTTPDRVFLLRLSILDIYNENLTDLLDANSRKLHIRENSDGTVFVENLSEEICTSPDDIVRLLTDGLARRHVGATNMNEYSSRSHSICRLIIESRPKEEEGVVTVSQLNFVDLAGSERVSQTGASGERLKEGQAINKSLFMLTLVITKLSEGGTFVNFRDSKLTRILQNALGGNSLTAIVCTVSPLFTYVDQTLSTIKFATSARNIATKPIINESVSNEAMMKRMQQEIAELRAKIAHFECTDARDRAKQELAEKEMLFRGAICSSTAISEEPKPPPRSRRLTWAPRDRCNFALTITDYELTKTNAPGSAIKRDLESILGRNGSDGPSEDLAPRRTSPVGNAPKRCRRREVIFCVPKEDTIKEASAAAEAEAEEESFSSDSESQLSYEDGVPTGNLIDIDDIPKLRSAATSPAVFDDKIDVDKEDKSTQSDPTDHGGNHDDLFTIGREIFLENSMAHFEAREEIVKLECEVRRLAQENDDLKEKLETSQATSVVVPPQPPAPPTQQNNEFEEKCRFLEDEVASVNSRYASLKNKYDQVVAALEDERKPDDEKASPDAANKSAELEQLAKSQADRIAELESLLSQSTAEIEATKACLSEMEAKLGETERNSAFIRKELEDLKCSYSVMEARFDATVDDKGQKDSENASLRGEIDRLVSQLEATKEELASASTSFQTKADELGNENKIIRDDLEAISSVKAQLESEKSEIEAKLTALQQELASASNFQTRADELENENKILRDDLEATCAVKTQMESEKSEVEAKLAALQQELASLSEEKNGLSDRVKELADNESALLAQLASSADDVSEISRLNDVLKQLQSEIEALTNDRDRLAADIATSRDENGQLQAKIDEFAQTTISKDEHQAVSDSLESKLKALEEENKQINSQVEELTSCCSALTAEKIEMKAKAESRLQHLMSVEAERADLNCLVEELKQSESSLTAKLALFSEGKDEAMAKFDALQADLGAQLEYANSEKQRLEGEIEAVRFESERLQTALAELSEVAKEKESLLSSIAELTSKANSLEEENARFASSVEALEMQKLEIETELASLSEKVALLEHEKVDLEAKISLLDSTTTQTDDAVQLSLELNEKIANLESEKRTNEEKICELEEQLKAVEADKEQPNSDQEERNRLTARVAELEEEIVKLKQECVEKTEEIELVRQEIDAIFVENTDLKTKVRQLQQEMTNLQPEHVVQELKANLAEKIEAISRLEADVSLLRQQVSVAEHERQIYLSELNDASQEAAKTRVELEKLKTFISTSTSEAACNTSLSTTAHHEETLKTLCNTPNYGHSPPRKTRLSAVMPKFSTELSSDGYEHKPGSSKELSSAEKTCLSMVSPSLTSPFSMSTLSAKMTPSKSSSATPVAMPIARFDCQAQTDDEPVGQIIGRIETNNEFKDKFILRSSYDSTVASYHETVALWDKMRLKMEKEAEHHRDRADRLIDAISKVIDGRPLSPMPTPVSIVEKTTLTATGGDATLSISTSDDNMDSLLNRLRSAIKEKEDNVRSTLSVERDGWLESAKEFEEEIARLNKTVANLEKSISGKEEEIKQMTAKIRAFETEEAAIRNNLTELQASLASKTDALRQRESELVDVKRSLDDRQTEVKRLQAELALTTASLVVADQGHKTSERGFSALQEQLMQEKAARSAAEGAISDLQVSLSHARSDADVWRERACAHEDEGTRLNSEITRLHAMFEAAEEQVRSLSLQKAQLSKSLEDMDSIVSQANSERDSAMMRLDQLETAKEQLARELHTAQQEVTKQQLMVDSLSKSDAAKEAKIEKSRQLFNRMRDEKAALQSRLEQLKEDKQRAVEIITKMKEERVSIENMVRESAEKCRVLEDRLEEIRGERDSFEAAMQASRTEVRRLRDEEQQLQRDVAKQLRDLGKAWRQCLINAGMPVSEQTETDPHQLIHEVRWTSKHSIAKLNVLHAISGLGVTCEWLYNESYEKISELEGSRRLMLAREMDASKAAENAKNLVLKLRKALAGCRCRSNNQHAELLAIDERVLQMLNRQPISGANAVDPLEPDENGDKKENRMRKAMTPKKDQPANDDNREVSMEISP